MHATSSAFETPRGSTGFSPENCPLPSFPPFLFSPLFLPNIDRWSNVQTFPPPSPLPFLSLFLSLLSHWVFTSAFEFGWQGLSPLAGKVREARCLHERRVHTRATAPKIDPRTTPDMRVFLSPAVVPRLTFPSHRVKEKDSFPGWPFTSRPPHDFHRSRTFVRTHARAPRRIRSRMRDTRLNTGRLRPRRRLVARLSRRARHSPFPQRQMSFSPPSIIRPTSPPAPRVLRQGALALRK